MTVGILKEKLKINMVIIKIKKVYPSGLLILPETYRKYENTEKI
jgi:hypothetical protein